MARGEKMKSLVDALSTLALAFAIAMALAWVWQGKEQPTDSTLDGIKATRADMHTSAAKQRACGPNASWHDIDVTTIQCVTKKNKPTVQRIL